jgi:hypothetical protein
MDAHRGHERDFTLSSSAERGRVRGRFMESPLSISFACIGAMNRNYCSSFQTLGIRFSLSQRERAGVRENCSIVNSVPVHGEGEELFEHLVAKFY